MKDMIAFCGMACHECPTLLATQADDDEKRAKVAKLLSKQFKMELKIEDINCDGCQQNSGRLLGHCLKCQIRKCGMGKKVLNCAYCSDYSCKKLDMFFNMMPDAKNRLDVLHK
ncbi:MAG: DUF3795 domain-containing protein [Syntrophales bacterium]